MLFGNPLRKLFALLLFSLIFHQCTSETGKQAKTNQQSPHLPYTIIKSSTYLGQKQFGFTDKHLYINNGTFESVGFYSNEKFSLFVQTNSLNFSITGFAIATQITPIQLIQLKENHQKMYKLERFKQIIMYEQSQESQQQNKQVSVQQQQKLYYANLTIYGICRTASVSTILKDLQVQIRYLNNTYQHTRPLAQNNQATQNNLVNSSDTQTIKIPTAVYCIDGLSIKQANYFVCKLYYIVVVSIFGLLLSFKPLKRLPTFVRITGLVAYLWIAVEAQSLYEALFSTYGAMFVLVIFYRLFEERSENLPQNNRRQTVLSKSYILASFASALPLAIKSHLDDESIEPKKITLHLINIVMLCNTVLFITSMVNITRFRHAFYYFLTILLAEHYFSHHVEKLLAFSILQLQVFPVPYECESLFFAFWLIPLCDFFFKSYSSETLYKFLIMLIPLLAKPLNISYSTTFAIGILIWTINGRLNGRDLIKIIKYKR